MKSDADIFVFEKDKTRFIGSRRLRRFHGVNGFPFILRILREIIDIRTLCPLHVPKAHLNLLAYLLFV